MLIDVFKEITNHLEGHCTVDDINEIKAYLNNKIVKAKTKQQIISSYTTLKEKVNLIQLPYLLKKNKNSQLKALLMFIIVI